jgi:type II secretory pathway pseudopilin PulG
MSHRAGGAGFSLIELLVATSISMIVVLLACTMALQAQYMWRTDSARVDLQQRARVTADVLTRALLAAGAGPSPGPARGPLIGSVAAIVPRRTGRRNADAPDDVRTDALTAIRVVPDIEHAVLLLPAAPGTSTIEITGAPSCDLSACGFVRGSNAMMIDALGNHDVFTVTEATGQVLTLRHHGSGMHPGYPAGTAVIAVDATNYFLDRNGHVLRSYDGDASDLPVVDDIVDMDVEYYGDRRPPLRPVPPADMANCLYESDGYYRASLLPVLSGTTDSEVRLTSEILSDGPWCGNGANQFDADLLRLRRIRITLRLQAGDPAVRGSDTTRFRLPGFARSAASEVPDVMVVVDVTPRNLRP